MSASGTIFSCSASENWPHQKTDKVLITTATKRSSEILLLGIYPPPLTKDEGTRGQLTPRSESSRCSAERRGEIREALSGTSLIRFVDESSDKWWWLLTTAATAVKRKLLFQFLAGKRNQATLPIKSRKTFSFLQSCDYLISFFPLSYSSWFCIFMDSPPPPSSKFIQILIISSEREQFIFVIWKKKKNGLDFPLFLYAEEIAHLS